MKHIAVVLFVAAFVLNISCTPYVKLFDMNLVKIVWFLF